MEIQQAVGEHARYWSRKDSHDITDFDDIEGTWWNKKPFDYGSKCRACISNVDHFEDSWLIQSG